MQKLPFARNCGQRSSRTQRVVLGMAYLLTAFVSLVLISPMIHMALTGLGPDEVGVMFCASGISITGAAAAVLAWRWRDYTVVGFVCVASMVAALGFTSFAPALVCMLLM